jgi:hypothetical protein
MFASRDRLGLGGLLLGVVFGSGALGCALTPRVAPAIAPTVAFGASDADVSSSCTPDGMPRVVATHIVPMNRISAVAEGDRVGLRFSTTRAPLVAMALDARTLDTLDGAVPTGELAPGDPGEPVRVELSNHRQLVVWMSGSIETGLSVQAITVAGDGSPSAPIHLGYEGTAVGDPTVAITDAGDGLIAFIESNGAGFQLVVTHMRCSTL